MPDPSTAGHINSQCVTELTDDGATGVDESTDPTDWSVSYGAGGGGFTSTLADLGTWAASMSGNSLLNEDLQSARLETTSEIEPGAPILYGLGIYQLGDGWYGHDGEAIGWQAIELHNPETGVSVVIAGNACASVRSTSSPSSTSCTPTRPSTRSSLRRALPRWTERSAAAAIRPSGGDDHGGHEHPAGDRSVEGNECRADRRHPRGDRSSNGRALPSQDRLSSGLRGAPGPKGHPLQSTG